MTTSKAWIISAVLWAGVGCRTPASSSPKPSPGDLTVSTLTQFPAGTFLENMVAVGDGSLLVTSYFAKEIVKVDAEGATTVFAELEDHPAGIMGDREGYWVSVMAKPFSEAPAFMRSNAIVRLSRQGAVVRRTPAPQARFLNGLHRLDSGEVLVADSVAGSLWRIEADGSLTPWLTDVALSPDPAQNAFLPGANGVKTHNGALYVSNSSRGAIFRRAAIDAGPIKVFARTGAVDDFVIDEDGTIFATTHGDQLLKITTTGKVSVVLAEGCGGCTSVLMSPDRQTLIVANDGDLLHGGKGRARVFTVRNFR